MNPYQLLQQINKIKNKHKKDGHIVVIFLDNYPSTENYTIEHLPIQHKKLFTIIPNNDIDIIQLKKRKKWRDQKKKYRANNKERSKAKAREYYHANKSKLLPMIYAARKRRLNK